MNRNQQRAAIGCTAEDHPHMSGDGTADDLEYYSRAEVNELQAELGRLRLITGQVMLLVDSGALRFVRDDAEARTIVARWRTALDR
jgi:hypothetical protein